MTFGHCELRQRRQSYVGSMAFGEVSDYVMTLLHLIALIVSGEGPHYATFADLSAAKIHSPQQHVSEHLQADHLSQRICLTPKPFSHYVVRIVQFHIQNYAVKYTNYIRYKHKPNDKCYR